MVLLVVGGELYFVCGNYTNYCTYMKIRSVKICKAYKNSYGFGVQNYLVHKIKVPLRKKTIEIKLFVVEKLHTFSF
jgi:hypothetical protein